MCFVDIVLAEPDLVLHLPEECGIIRIQAGGLGRRPTSRTRSECARADRSDSKGEDEDEVRALWDVLVGLAPGSYVVWAVVVEIGLTEPHLVLVLPSDSESCAPRDPRQRLAAGRTRCGWEVPILGGRMLWEAVVGRAPGSHVLWEQGAWEELVWEIVVELGRAVSDLVLVLPHRQGPASLDAADGASTLAASQSAARAGSGERTVPTLSGGR
eukprot:gene14235-biopygen5328